jgi:antibiotic biosynthesis monooxygenase (ABM) superfamily enzyme
VPILPKILVTTLVMAPVMTYLVMPRVTRMLRPWLTRRPAVR